ncbi:MAG: hypothetical protein ACOY4U_08890 [Pseudomonadota bacterium]
MATKSTGPKKQSSKDLQQSLQGAIAAYLRSCLHKAFGPRPGAKGRRALEEATLAALESVRQQPATRQRAAGFNKASYMERFMASKRERERRAADLENRRRELDGLPRLRGESRERFMREQARQWKTMLEDELLRRRKGDPNGYLPFAYQQEIRELFWKSIDQELARREIENRRASHPTDG